MKLLLYPKGLLEAAWRKDKKLYADGIKPECFLDKESLEKWYGGAHGGFHKMYIVEIKNIYSE